MLAGLSGTNAKAYGRLGYFFSALPGSPHRPMPTPGREKYVWHVVDAGAMVCKRSSMLFVSSVDTSSTQR